MNLDELKVGIQHTLAEGNCWLFIVFCPGKIYFKYLSVANKIAFLSNVFIEGGNSSVYWVLDWLKGKVKAPYFSTIMQCLQSTFFQCFRVGGITFPKNNFQTGFLDPFNVSSLLYCEAGVKCYCTIFKHTSNEQNIYFYQILDRHTNTPTIVSCS